MLKLEDINLFYGEVQALWNVSLEVEDGETIALLGANAAGKSTTINAISGLEKISSGRILYQGEEIHEKSPHEIVRLGIIQVPEGRKLFSFMTVEENLELGAYSERARKDFKKNLEMVYELFPILKERRKQLAGSMSGGQQQMCAIARGLMGSPKILMIDDLSSPIAALVEPLSIANHAAEAVGKVKPGDKVWVQGCGIIGFFVGVVCRFAGAEVTIAGLPKDKEARLRHASSFGMKPFIMGESDNTTEKVDLLFECSGSPGGIRDGLERLKKGGRAVMVALYEHDITLPLTKAVRNEWELLTSYGCQPSDYVRSFSILKQLKSQLQNVVSVYPIAMARQAFDDALQQKVLKPILNVKG